MSKEPSALACRLAEQAEAVCRHYLSSGRRAGRYWLVGDIRNTPGRSLFVRLARQHDAKGAAGKWTDAKTGDHGDLLDIIRESCGLSSFREAAEEARRFLGLPEQERVETPALRPSPLASGLSDAARRLFAMSRPIRGTIAEAYLRHRGITALHDIASLRFHPRCFYRSDGFSPTQIWPAMVAAVSDLGGALTGVHRTWLDPSGHGKAPVDTPRRAMGQLLGFGVRFGISQDVLAAGEGIETILSLRSVVPAMPMLAALSAAHLGAIQFHGPLRRLYIARDNDPAGTGAASKLATRAIEAGIEVILLSPGLSDFNEDLATLGFHAVRQAVRTQIAPEDVARFMDIATHG